MSSEDFTYEHFPVVCPTCEGTGTIEEDAGHMVTFVPVKDERLRPAWTKVKIAALVVVIMVIGGCTTYFLYPRTVNIQINAHEIKDYDFDSPSPWIEYSFVMNVSNPNFFPITLKGLTMQMLYVEVIVSNRRFKDDYHVGMRTIKEDTVTMRASYDSKSVGRYIKKECYKNRNYVPQLMVSYAELSYWMHTQHIQSKDDYFFTDCDSMIFPLPTLSTTATTTRAKKTTTTSKAHRNSFVFTTTTTSHVNASLVSKNSEKKMQVEIDSSEEVTEKEPHNTVLRYQKTG